MHIKPVTPSHADGIAVKDGNGIMYQISAGFYGPKDLTTYVKTVKALSDIGDTLYFVPESGLVLSKLDFALALLH